MAKAIAIQGGDVENEFCGFYLLLKRCERQKSCAGVTLCSVRQRGYRSRGAVVLPRSITGSG